MTDEARRPEDETRPDAGDMPDAAEPSSGSASQASDEMPDAQSSTTPPAHQGASEASEDDELGIEREIELLRIEAESHLNDARRIKAEFENYKKRMLREQSALLERASSSLVERLLPVLDSFRLAIVAADRTKSDREFLRGVELVYGELLEVLRKEGLEEIDAEGKPFDPEVHEAVMQVDADVPAGHVVEVMRIGYRLKGRVLRAAMVSVARG